MYWVQKFINKNEEDNIIISFYLNKKKTCSKLIRFIQREQILAKHIGTKKKNNLIIE